jgi:hypothetical protein
VKIREFHYQILDGEGNKGRIKQERLAEKCRKVASLPDIGTAPSRSKKDHKDHPEIK